MTNVVRNDLIAFLHTHYKTTIKKWFWLLNSLYNEKGHYICTSKMSGLLISY